MPVFTLQRDTITPFIAEAARKLRNPRGLVAGLCSRVADELRDHFAQRDQEPNKHNWPKQHFWGQLREATGVGEIGETAGEVRVADYRLAQRIHGGTILPKEKKRLAFAIHPLAYGLRAGAEGGSGFSSFTASTGIKLHRVGNQLVGDLNGERVGFYALARKVTQSADPRALPPKEQIAGAMTEAADEYFEFETATTNELE